jgi:hypothetical protein
LFESSDRNTAISHPLEQRNEIQAIVKDEVGLLRPVLIQALWKRLV